VVIVHVIISVANSVNTMPEIYAVERQS